MKIGSYLPSVVLLSTAMLFGGLGEWAKARWIQTSDIASEKPVKEVGAVSQERTPVKWIARRRPVLPAVLIVIATHLLGVLLFYIRTREWFITNQDIASPILCGVLSVIPLAALLMEPTSENTTAPIYLLLKSLNLCLASTVISIISVLNFSLAAVLAILLGLPLSLSSPSSKSSIRLAKYSLYILLGLSWLILGRQQIQDAVWNWEVLGVWFAPFVCVVYTPLVLQAAIVCLLPP
ncbi:hypothetical protein PHLCEN_2v9148 [Hermanssonia centrifuga]|uniref:Uncharacterized protein n=1 Tax=Hermanssonia centrifuga TaxID=98765 RepID=A0A2R6NRR0_9APHY|nr:hypothetical protein PHLCEN_2v9148 [Hermanssonia centrifuga]